MEFSVERITAIIIATLLTLAWGILFAAIMKDVEKKEKPEKKKNPKKILKKNRKDLIKRIKSMTPEQFDAYYETLVEIYAGSTHSSTSGLSLREQLERQAEIHSSTEDEA